MFTQQSSRSSKCKTLRLCFYFPCLSIIFSLTVRCKVSTQTSWLMSRQESCFPQTKNRKFDPVFLAWQRTLSLKCGLVSCLWPLCRSLLLSTFDYIYILPQTPNFFFPSCFFSGWISGEGRRCYSCNWRTRRINVSHSDPWHSILYRAAV